MDIKLNDNFVRISSKKLEKNMYISEDIYYYYNGEYVLAFRHGIRLSDNNMLLIKKLENTYGGIYVYGTNADNVMFKMQYNNIKENVIGIFNDIANNEVINQESADLIGDLIYDQMNIVNMTSVVDILNTVRSVDEYLYTHSTNVAFLNGLMGRWLGMSENEVQSLIRGGILHDVGKMDIPLEILNKPGKLTDEEFEIVKKHPISSYNKVLEAGITDQIVLDAVRYHHEKVNGKGYPEGLVYDDIPLAARITAISDVYDAMVTKRVYKDAYSPFAILEELSKGSFINLDMDLVSVFLEHMPDELIGKRVDLSNGSVAEVVFVAGSDFSKPIVKVGSSVFQTGKDVECVSMHSSTGDNNKDDKNNK